MEKSSPLLSIVETANHEGNPQEGKQNQELQELQVTDGIRREIDYVGKTIIVVSNRSSGDITKKVTSSLYIYIKKNFKKNLKRKFMKRL